MNRRGRRLLGLVGAAVVVASLAYVARPAGHVPPYDANLVRLAESQLDGYCAGEAFWTSQGDGDGRIADACRARLAEQKSRKPDARVVVGAFCEGVMDAGWEGTAYECVGTLTDGRLWPTYDGSLTDQWNRARPYPRPALAPSSGSEIDDGSRTGDRPGASRPL